MFVAIAVQCILLENPDSSIKERIKPHFHSCFHLIEAIASAGVKKKKRKREGQLCPSYSFPISLLVKTQYCP